MPTVSKGLYTWWSRSPAVLEDFADRLNHVWTVALLFVCAVFVSYNQNYQQPISCWTPNRFTMDMGRYTHSVCWNSHVVQYYQDAERTAKTLNISIDKIRKVPSELPYVWHDTSSVITPEDDEHYEVNKMSKRSTYYQWIPLMLCLQALLFKLPSIIMYVFHGYSGVSFSKVSGLTGGFEHMGDSERRQLARQIARFLYTKWEHMRSTIPYRLLTMSWLVVKILFFVNVIVQLSLLDGFLRTPYLPNNDTITSYGDILRMNLGNNATHWRTSLAFPRKVLCWFSIPQFENVQNFIVMCHLPANAFNEHVYAFLWVWLFFVTMVTGASLLVWVTRRIIPVFRRRYLTAALEMTETFDAKMLSYTQIRSFCDAIGEDGVMVLKLTSENSSELLVSDIVYNLWTLMFGKHIPMTDVTPEMTTARPFCVQPNQAPDLTPGYQPMGTGENKRLV